MSGAALSGAATAGAGTGAGAEAGADHDNDTTTAARPELAHPSPASVPGVEAGNDAAYARTRVEEAAASGGKTEEGEATAESVRRHLRDSTILASVAAGSVAGTAVDGRQALLNWLPGPHYTPTGQTWTLIYRGSRDGWQASDFHAACDDKGPTMVLVLGTAKDDGREFVVGGYAATPWTTPGSWQSVADPESARSVGRGSFLFSLVDAAGHGPVQLRLKDPADGRAQMHDACRGPMFGYDVGVGGNRRMALNGVGGSWAATSYRHASYDATAAAAQGCTTFRGADHPQAKAAYSFTTKELEVFALQ